jgi:hypothetical protein
MVGFTDLSPSVDMCELRDGVEMPCPGLSPGQIGALLKRFPALEKRAKGGNLDWMTLLDMSDEVIHAAIAAGFGYPGDKEQEAAVGKNLSTAEKCIAIKKIWETSIGPLMEVVSDLGSQYAEAQRQPAAPSPRSSTKSAKPPSS